MSITTLAPTAIQPADDGIVFDPITADDVPVARTYVHLTLLHAPYEVADDTALVVSELLGNAILHGGPRVTLTVRRTPAGIEVRVADEGERDTPADTRAPGEHGLGLLIAEALTTGLTVTRTGNGTVAAATMRTPKDTR